MNEQQIQEAMNLTDSDQSAAITFSHKLLRDWMRRNTVEGMTIQQSLWVFSRFEEFAIEINGVSKKVDMFKMFQSGALPTLYYCLLKIQPDPMTESFHWVTQSRIDWVKNEISAWLGTGMTGYIQSLS